MTASNAYASLDDVKLGLGMNSPDQVDDVKIDIAREAASRLIDERCDRTFYGTSTASARVYSAVDPCVLHIHDFHSTSGLTVKVDTALDGTFDQTWTLDTDHQLEPLNGIVDGETRPWNVVRAIGAKYFPQYKGRARVQVTAQWGWASVPTSVRQACIIQAVTLFKSSDAALGFAGFGEAGVRTLRQALHPSAEALVRAYARYPIPVF